MGICPNCGKELDANGFCYSCGFRLMYDPPAVVSLKKILTSPMTLVIMILFGVKLILSLIPVTDYDIVGRTVYSFEPDLNSIILFIGLLFAYIDARKPMGVRVDPRGLKIIRVYQIVLGIILFVALILCGFLMFVLGNTFVDYLNMLIPELEMFNSISYIVAAVFIVIALFAAILYYFIAKTVKSFIDVALTGAPNRKISTFVIIICIITAISGLVGILSVPMTAVEIIVSCCDTVISIVSAVALIRVKSEMRKIEDSFMQKM